MRTTIQFTIVANLKMFSDSDRYDIYMTESEENFKSY